MAGNWPSPFFAFLWTETIMDCVSGKLQNGRCPINFVKINVQTKWGFERKHVLLSIKKYFQHWESESYLYLALFSWSCACCSTTEPQQKEYGQKQGWCQKPEGKSRSLRNTPQPLTTFVDNIGWIVIWKHKSYRVNNKVTSISAGGP